MRNLLLVFAGLELRKTIAANLRAAVDPPETLVIPNRAESPVRNLLLVVAAVEFTSVEPEKLPHKILITCGSPLGINPVCTRFPGCWYLIDVIAVQAVAHLYLNEREKNGV